MEGSLAPLRDAVRSSSVDAAGSSSWDSTRSSSLAHEAFLGLGRTWAALEHSVAELLKPHGVTPTQYNVLRILRGFPDGLCRGEVQERLIAKVPDATRLLDRLQERGLITRERSADDRRYVYARITERGLGTLADLDVPVSRLHERQLGGLEPDDLARLVEILERVREAL